MFTYCRQENAIFPKFKQPGKVILVQLCVVDPFKFWSSHEAYKMRICISRVNRPANTGRLVNSLVDRNPHMTLPEDHQTGL